MNDSRRLYEKVAAYRDLSAEERRQAEQDPQLAELLRTYREMDAQIAALPKIKPRPGFRDGVYAALAEESHPGAAARLLAWMGRAPLRAGRLVGAITMLLLLLGFAYAFREQLRLSAGPEISGILATEGTSTPPATPLPSRTRPTRPGEQAASPWPTPTFAVPITPDAPFAPFAGYMRSWPENQSLAYGSLRAGMTAYLQRNGGISALQDAAALAALENELRPLVYLDPDSLQVVDLFGDSNPELIVALLPLVDVYMEDASGVIHIRGVAQPRHWSAEDTWPEVVRITDLTGDSQPELWIEYPISEASHTSRELVVAQWNPQRYSWTELLRLALNGWAGEYKAYAMPQDGPDSIESSCSALGVLDAQQAPHMQQRTVYSWDGNRFAPVFWQREAPSTTRQYVNVAEAYLRAGNIRAALEMMRRLHTGAVALADEPAQDLSQGQPAWSAYAALRAGQLYAVLGDEQAALEALREASLSGTTIGRLAGRFRSTYEASGDAAVAWTAMLQEGEIYDQAAEDSDTLKALLYPGMAAAAALNPMAPEEAVVAAEERWQQLGLPVRFVLDSDLDVDGQAELAIVLELPDGSLSAWVLDRGADGWFAAQLGSLADEVVTDEALLPGPLLEGPQAAPGHGFEAVRVGDELVGWDGRFAHHFQDGMPSTDPRHLCPVRPGGAAVAGQQSDPVVVTPAATRAP